MNALVPTKRLPTVPEDKKAASEPLAMKEEKKEKKPNPWNLHVKEFRKSHPELSFKEVLTQAKATYTKLPAKPQTQKKRKRKTVESEESVEQVETE